jgi:hypothetical protein
LEDRRHGKGVFMWPDGATYEGDFIQGQLGGHGRYTFSDGGYYGKFQQSRRMVTLLRQSCLMPVFDVHSDGSWVDGRYEGHGVCHWPDGRVYKGKWKAGMPHGQGVETYPGKQTITSIHARID